MSDETEADTRANRIDPVIDAAGWKTTPGARVRRELICPGRIMSGGRRGPSKTADYVFEYRGKKLAVMEAKKAGLGYTVGMGQAKDYAGRLKARFGFSSNGIGWREVDMKSGAERDLALPFPTPDELWDRVYPKDNVWRDRFGAVPFETGGGKWEPRYYQHNAITAVLEAVAKGDRRILLTLATGTGKTGVAFQVAWKLFHSSWNLSGEPTRRPRILFLADRNILADQAFNSFSAFEAGALSRINPKEIRKRDGRMPKNASVFFSIFQTMMTSGDAETNEDEAGEILSDGPPNYLQYPPDFFDFIVIDECHRGGANDESTWRAILDHFAPAVQLGLTATPKRNDNVDTYAYFGEPVYTYALKEGIEDGFLTPFKVRQMASTMDDYTFSPGDTVIDGEIEEDRKYTEGDFNTKIVIEERERSRVREFMKQIDPRQKTLVFCATQDHAARVRDYINEMKVVPDPHYCERVTAEDAEIGEAHLRTFQDNEKTIPTILTTSQKLSTGVDARNIRNIVLMRPIRSMIEFKQIIGRGTRTFEGKDYFTIYDFVKAYEHFNDPEWDGEPLEPPERPGGVDGDAEEHGGLGEDEAEFVDDGPGDPRPARIRIQLADGKERRIQYMASTSYWVDGKPISAEDFMKRLFGDLTDIVSGEDELREKWSDPELRAKLFTALEERGYDLERLEEMGALIDARDSDVFDVLAYVRFSLDPKTRRDRADAARRDGLEGFELEMRDFLKDVLHAYEREGVSELGYDKLGDRLRIRYGSTSDAKRSLGNLASVRAAFSDLQKFIYAQ
ncbi:MAG: DEAD/DEAH box helicase family protein [Henriciella sp.]|uniref:EcoAI/FtnUII family type I restriction enzme subunit R n=1 Tax=Henriciella sp. TaxID=1968823 RepID=UPI0032EEC380